MTADEITRAISSLAPRQILICQIVNVRTLHNAVISEIWIMRVDAHWRRQGREYVRKGSRACPNEIQDVNYSDDQFFDKHRAAA